VVLRILFLLALWLCALSAVAIDVPPHLRPFVQDAPANREGRLQWLCGSFGLCEMGSVNRSFALVVGVSQGRHNAEQPTDSDNAAKLAAQLLESGEFDQVVLLRDKVASKDNIHWFMDFYYPDLFKRYRNSRFLFYFVGSSQYDEVMGRGYLKLAESETGGRQQNISMDTVATWAESTTSAAVQSLFLIDACVSGLIGLEAMKGMKERDASEYGPGERLTGRSGWLMTACKGGDRPLIDPAQGGSLFTQAVISGLKGDADRMPSDGIIGSGELFTHIKASLSAAARGKLPQTLQEWHFRSGTGDFFFKSPAALASQKPRPPAPALSLPKSPQAPVTSVQEQAVMEISEPDADVAALLKTCKAHFDADRLTTGQEGNAADCYNSVLALEPANLEAQTGLLAIIDRYRDWAEKKFQAGALDQAQGYMLRIERVDPQAEALLELRSMLQEAKSSPAPAKPMVLPMTDYPQLAGEMVRIKGGCFQMGSPPDELGRDKDERYHRVCVKEFIIGKTEVTQRQWQEVMNTNPSYFSRCDDCPVEQVTWDNVQTYLQRLNARTGVRFRLPTEAEWEYAARAGTTGPFNFDGPIGLEKVNYNARYSYAGSEKGSYPGKTLEVGSLPPNPWGLYDMHGNVWEWTCSGYDPDYNGGEKNCVGSEDNAPRVIRGGTWLNKPVFARSANRYKTKRDLRGSDVGFRVVLD
jgi:formylglycine-generating enzyme required for sulfatase activity